MVERGLDDHVIGSESFHHRIHLAHDRVQALGQRQPRRRRHVARGHAVQLAGAALDHAPTRPAAPGVQSQHAHVVASP